MTNQRAHSLQNAFPVLSDPRKAAQSNPGGLFVFVDRRNLLKLLGVGAFFPWLFDKREKPGRILKGGCFVGKSVRGPWMGWSREKHAYIGTFVLDDSRPVVRYLSLFDFVSLRLRWENGWIVTPDGHYVTRVSGGRVVWAEGHLSSLVSKDGKYGPWGKVVYCRGGNQVPWRINQYKRS